MIECSTFFQPLPDLVSSTNRSDSINGCHHSLLHQLSVHLIDQLSCMYRIWKNCRIILGICLHDFKYPSSYAICWLLCGNKIDNCSSQLQSMLLASSNKCPTSICAHLLDLLVL
uniref:Uncharacterized protein n=1 Tax=Opuntia streptacantha TaxID=393608 RepID=A0A7C9F1S2_OPUST